MIIISLSKEEFESEFKRIKELLNGTIVLKLDNDVVECPTTKETSQIEELSIDSIMTPLDANIKPTLATTSTTQGKIRVPRKMV